MHVSPTHGSAVVCVGRTGMLGPYVPACNARHCAWHAALCLHVTAQTVSGASSSSCSCLFGELGLMSRFRRQRLHRIQWSDFVVLLHGVQPC